MSAGRYAYVYVCMYIYIYIYIRVCVHIYIYVCLHASDSETRAVIVHLLLGVRMPLIESLWIRTMRALPRFHAM